MRIASLPVALLTLSLSLVSASMCLPAESSDRIYAQQGACWSSSREACWAPIRIQLPGRMGAQTEFEVGGSPAIWAVERPIDGRVTYQAALGCSTRDRWRARRLPIP
jgi:hypothetical protein